MPFYNSPQAPVDPRYPEPYAICDRCGFRYLHKALSFQFDWRGNALANIHILVCDRCLDKPFEFNRPVIVGPDPVPVNNPRPGSYATQEGTTPAVPVRQIIGE